ncbi:MAG: beta-propeller domain-containing protein [Thaumarchaeota archaeon]|nr:beta-propeller domain-containing protein [Nitrososphaerota archaeon]
MQREERVFASVLVIALLASAAAVILAPTPARTIGRSGQLSSFLTYDQLTISIAKSGTSSYANDFRSVTLTSAFPSAGLALVSGASSAPSFTTTNIQVQGVDEPDIVKTDGTYMYVVSGRTVSIVLAYPPEKAGTVQTLKFDSDVQGILISSGRLVVIGNGLVNYSRYGYVQTADVFLYDVANASEPSLIRHLSVNGTYVDARLNGGYVYAILQQPTEVWSNGTTTVVPATLRDGKTTQTIAPSAVYYSTGSLVPFSMYTIILSLSVTDGSHTQNAVLTGWGSTIYASTTNVYLAFPDRVAYPVYFGAPTGIRAVPGGISILPFWWGGWGSNTTIFRIAYSDGTTQVASEGTVPGTILNQFSLDENNGYLRVATTSNSMLGNQTWVRVNNVYVLNSEMSVVGSLEGLGPNENIYSARFVGDFGYMVTYERIDPLFTISLSDPAHPAVLNALELTGFSDYLHPLGNGYLLGVGKQTIPAPAEQGYVLYQGMKLSLFHVASDGSSTEVSRVLIGDRGSDSPVSYDHRAFVYDPATGLVALPITVAKVDNSSYQDGAPYWAYGTPVWQGAYLFNFSTGGGFQFIGRITQIANGTSVQDSTDFYVNRIVLIGGYVYTLSNRMLLITDFSTLADIGKVKLP